jgi:hypothetical protein
MRILNKFFGSSKIQEEFQKSIMLKIPLIISAIDKIEFTFKGNQISKRNSEVVILFEFLSSQLVIEGEFIDEIINENHFIINRIESLNDTPEIFISKIEFPDVIVMKCIIYRNYILFQGTLENWSFKVYDNFRISH